MGLCDEAEEAEYSRLRSDKQFVDVDALSERTARGVGAVAPFLALSKASAGGLLAFVVKRIGHLFTGGGKGAGTAAFTAKNVAVAGALIGLAGAGTYVAVKANQHSPKAATPKPKVVSAPASCGVQSGASGIQAEIRVEAGRVTCAEARRVFRELPAVLGAADAAGQGGVTVLGWNCVPGGPGIVPVSAGQTCTRGTVRIAAIGDSQHPAGQSSGPAESPAPASTSTVSCTASGFGEGGADVPFSVTGLDCAAGEQVVKDALGGGFTGGSSFDVDEFACSTVSSPQAGSRVTCRKSSEKVEFSLPG